jgi:murein DD-endopeptidase MepM/ murein hydrolase activator NlpD
MKIRITILFFLCSLSAYGQTLADLEERRAKTLADIEYVDKMLRETSTEKASSLQGLNIVNSKLRLRESVISDIQEQIELLTVRIELNETAIVLMEDDLEMLLRDYEKAILHAQRVSKGQPDFAYIFSARDINQGYKRLKYLQQVAKYRRREAELILDIKSEIERNKSKQEQDLKEIVSLKEKEEQQKSNLQREQRQKRSLLNRLSRQEKQLRQDLQDKRRIAREIEKEIERVIEEERRKRESIELTPEEVLTGDDFIKNKGLLPWPVEKGVITSKYGIHDHPLLKGTRVDNIGIEITSSEKIKARTVFKGSVVSVFGISGGNMAVIVRHGQFLTVYQNLVNVVVKPGDIVETKQILGDVFSDGSDSGKCIIKFMIYQEKDKKDPEEWLAKKRM